METIIVEARDWKDLSEHAFAALSQELVFVMIEGDKIQFQHGAQLAQATVTGIEYGMANGKAKIRIKDFKSEWL